MSPNQPAGGLETPAPRVVALAGSPYQMGLRHGQVLAPEIRLLAQQMRPYVFARVGAVRGVGLRILAQTFALAMNRHIPARLREEMRGIAQGSGVPYHEILLLNTLDDVLNVLRRLAPRSPGVGCSSFVLFGSRSHDGTLMHGRNLDYHFRGTPLADGGAVARLLHRHAVLFAYQPQGLVPFVAVGWPGVCGVTTAMNREGLSLGNLTSYVRGTSPDGMPTAVLYRTIMEQASSLGEVGGVLRRAPRTVGNNLLVGSGRENSAALFEITRDSVQEVPPADGLLVVTNHFLSPALAQRQRPFLPAHSVDRWKRLQTLCDRRGITVRDALAFLGDVGSVDEERAGHPFARVANEGTAVSVLFEPAKSRMWVAVSEGPPASRGEFREMEVGTLLATPLDEG